VQPGEAEEDLQNDGYDRAQEGEALQGEGDGGTGEAANTGGAANTSEASNAGEPAGTGGAANGHAQRETGRRVAPGSPHADGAPSRNGGGFDSSALEPPSNGEVSNLNRVVLP
jgi:hypothetical protein